MCLKMAVCVTSCNTFMLKLVVVILLLLKDCDARTNAQDMKKLEDAKDEGGNTIMAVPAKEDFDIKKVILANVRSRVEVPIERGKGNLGGRKVMIKAKEKQQKQGMKMESMIMTSQEASMISGANFVGNKHSRKRKLETPNNVAFMALSADYGKMARVHPPRNN